MTYYGGHRKYKITVSVMFEHTANRQLQTVVTFPSIMEHNNCYRSNVSWFLVLRSVAIYLHHNQ